MIDQNLIWLLHLITRCNVQCVSRTFKRPTDPLTSFDHEFGCCYRPHRSSHRHPANYRNQLYCYICILYTFRLCAIKVVLLIYLLTFSDDKSTQLQPFRYLWLVNLLLFFNWTFVYFFDKGSQNVVFRRKYCFDKLNLSWGYPYSVNINDNNHGYYLA